MATSEPALGKHVQKSREEFELTKLKTGAKPKSGSTTVAGGVEDIRLGSQFGQSVSKKVKFDDIDRVESDAAAVQQRRISRAAVYHSPDLPTSISDYNFPRYRDHAPRRLNSAVSQVTIISRDGHESTKPEINLHKVCITRRVDKLLPKYS